MKILVADDHQMIVNGLILDLNSLVPDAEVTGTSSSKEVMELCKENRYDIVFMDIDMPGTDGISMAKKILANQLTYENETAINDRINDLKVRLGKSTVDSIIREFS